MEKQKTIVITGVTRGLGFALAERFYERGHRVIGCGRSDSIIEEMNDQFHRHSKFSVVDLAVEPEVQDWAYSTLEGFGPPDLLINNAALINKPAPLWEVSEQEIEDIIDVNIKGVIYMVRHFVPSMVRTNHGIIVNLSSGWGRSTAPQVTPYCTTKWAIEGLSGGLAQELPDGMACVALNPGIIQTEMLSTVEGFEDMPLPDPDEWGHSAAAMLLKLTPEDNGKSLDAPGV